MMTRNSRGRTKLTLRVALVAATTLLLTNVWADGGFEHQQRQARPIPLGVSGGSIDDQDGAFCCGGTLGALVEDGGGIQFVLSNNHVLARTNRATIGEDVVQPGLIDVGCAMIPSDVVADLSNFVPLDFDGTNLVDAAIAEARSGLVDSSGAILDIGPLSTETLAPFVGLQVKKSGRTTGLTFGEVAAVDVSVNVTYSKRCGSRGGNTASFVNQFRVTPGDFSAGGDSGSLITEDALSNPRAVGLLFAGSSTSTIGNPIDFVLSAFGVAMVGGTPPPLTTGSISGTVSSAADGSPIGGALVEVDTGQSATTASDGSYTITDVPTGTRSVTASASGFESQTKPATVNENQTTIVNFALNPVTSAANAIVDCITYDTSGGKGGTKDLLVTVSMVDDFGNSVSGADVSVSVTFPDGGVGTGTGTTDSSGDVTFRARNAPDGCYRTDVTNVVAPGLAFDGTEPPNGFDKGTDPTPDEDCRSASDDCGEIPFSAFGKRGRFVRPDVEKMRLAIAAKRQHEPNLLKLEGVVGMGVSVSADGKTPVIEVYLESDDSKIAARVPRLLRGVPVRTVVTGQFIAY